MDLLGEGARILRRRGTAENPSAGTSSAMKRSQYQMMTLVNGIVVFRDRSGNVGGGLDADLPPFKTSIRQRFHRASR